MWDMRDSASADVLVAMFEHCPNVVKLTVLGYTATVASYGMERVRSRHHIAGPIDLSWNGGFCDHQITGKPL
ncbi:hypothetical protein BGX33_000608 [Mortierella sp. NVP41]|nr:hypothetical protein BGX33_000608 [Mortierella sp. NVP41]